MGADGRETGQLRSRLKVGGPHVQDFQFFVTDDRSTVRTVMFVQTLNADRARFLARRLLNETHHHAVEVWSDDRRLFTISDADPSEA
jgi:hypothetical protein